MSTKNQKWSMKVPESKEDTLVKRLWYLAFSLGLVGICLNVVLFLLAQKREANTSSALHTLRNFHSAQVVYVCKPGNGSYASTGAELNTVNPDEGSGFIAKHSTEMQQTPDRGFIIASMKATPKTPDRESTYSMVIVPEVRTGLFRTGDDCFYVDQTGEIRHSGSPTVLPDANSPLLQP